MTHDTSERKLTYLPQTTLSARPVCAAMKLESTDRKHEPAIRDRSLLLPGVSLTVCLMAPIAILALTLPDGYLSLDGEGEGVFAVFLLSPCLVLASFAWWQRHHRRESVALFVLIILLVGGGVWLLAAEASGYRAALAGHPRGPDYMRHRYQKMELFIVPALQWLACLVIGAALVIGAWRKLQRGSEVVEQESPQ